MFAAEGGNSEIVKMPIAKGAKVNKSVEKDYFQGHGRTRVRFAQASHIPTSRDACEGNFDARLFVSVRSASMS